MVFVLMYCSNASAAKCIDREHIIVVIASVSVLQYISFSMLDILRLLTTFYITSHFSNTLF